MRWSSAVSKGASAFWAKNAKKQKRRKGELEALGLAENVLTYFALGIRTIVKNQRKEEKRKEDLAYHRAKFWVASG